MAGNDPYVVGEITALKKVTGRSEKEARELLERIYRQVQPVMRKHQWKVGKLSEMFPKNANLLGLNYNRGSEIKIRLRPARDKGSFMPYESLVGTMLHELTHNVHGPHDAKFYKLLDEITAECEEYMSKGITGSGVGFDAGSMGRLGGRGPVAIHNPPPEKLRAAAAEAALKRARAGALMTQGGRRLGGDTGLARALA
eukprot:CAMPEP_0182897128 /NCGR_PEP_ID=MMETSP0034_2-20130328/26705_1 /TAXON_ID=156128 /ORGANISM="Nephroselmis pyriformis, Strain CCMP717" /LENGTH=197 /DNA_ID=CAMNT_0025031029 /DNA_START=63 /DNA_END=652 /DNA_ORIENTATION=+